MKYLFVILSLVIISSSCNKVIDCGEGAVVIRVVNQSEMDFDTISLAVRLETDEILDLVFTDLDAGDTSKDHYLDQIEIMYYEEESEYVFFTNWIKGISGENELFETGFGFCGTGLIFEYTKSGIYEAVITDVDIDNKRMTLTQVRK